MKLYDALKAFKEKYPKMRFQEVETLQDSHGKYGFVVKSQKDLSKVCILSAKNSKNGAEVSVHKELMETAKAKGWPVILCIDDVWYLFLPADIEREGHENERHGQQMVNFHIRLGRRLDEPKEAKEHPKVEMMKRELSMEFQR